MIGETFWGSVKVVQITGPTTYEDKALYFVPLVVNQINTYSMAEMSTSEASAILITDYTDVGPLIYLSASIKILDGSTQTISNGDFNRPPIVGDKFTTMIKKSAMKSGTPAPVSLFYGVCTITNKYTDSYGTHYSWSWFESDSELIKTY